MLNSNKLLYFLFFFFVGGFLWTVALFFMPKGPVFYMSVSKDYNFYKIDLVKVFYNEKSVKKANKKPLTVSMKGIKLKSVYFDGKKGFVIIEDKGKTVFVDLNKTYKGYRLVKINKDSAIFTKNGKNYKISFGKDKIKSNFYSLKSYKEKPKTVKIKKTVFKQYKNNILKIWTNIGIIKTKKGYMITFIKPKSIFEKIGLRRGDILLEVNGRKLKNDLDAWNLYRNADKFKTFEIKILRNHKEKVLYYEVD